MWSQDATFFCHFTVRWKTFIRSYFRFMSFLSFPSATDSLRHLFKIVAHRVREFRGNIARCWNNRAGDRDRSLPRPRAALAVMGGVLPFSAWRSKWCSRRISETKHDASEAESPSRARQRKGSSHSERGRGAERYYASIGLDWIRQVEIPKGSRCDATEQVSCKFQATRERMERGMSWWKLF